jgi:mannose-6-phosphate isomerase-like protein (cupin superfamily)
MKITVRDQVAFKPDRLAKVALARTPRVQLDLYCVQPGQQQAAHTHADQDKIYVVLEGRGRFVRDGVEETLESGEALVAPAGAVHGLVNDSEAPLVALVIVAPPPPHG